MIASLNVENIALIDRLQIDFADGLNVLSGETGAGKSVLLDAMNLILGERAERTLIRHGQDRAHVEAVVYPDEATAQQVRDLDIPYEDELIVTRDLTANGKSTSRINGRAVTLATLKAVMGHLVDLHGQHEHQSLLDADRHTSLLDAMAGSPAVQISEKIHEEWKKLSSLRKELASLGGDPAERENTAELLRFQISEVRSAAVEDGELDQLEKEQKRLENAEAMKRALYAGDQALSGGDDSGGVLAGLRQVTDALERYAELDDRLPELVQTCDDAYYSLQDVSTTLSSVVESLDIDEERVHEVEDRVDEIRGLLRKYQALDEAALNASLEQWTKQLAELENAESRAAELQGLVEDQRARLASLYRDLSKERRAAAQRLSASLLQQLEALGMGGAEFEVRFSGLEEGGEVRYGAASPETAEFFLSVNRGEPLKPLSKVASGGEISRIMLAFKVISAEHDEIGTLIFDEIDTGISGHTAQIVGEKMAQIGLSRQVIAVTHLPQIAVMADRNFYIHKDSDETRTVTHIDELDADGVRSEMVRLTGGLESENAEAHADDMMQRAARIKEEMGAAAGR